MLEAFLQGVIGLDLLLKLLLDALRGLLDRVDGRLQLMTDLLGVFEIALGRVELFEESARIAGVIGQVRQPVADLVEHVLLALKQTEEFVRLLGDSGRLLVGFVDCRRRLIILERSEVHRFTVHSAMFNNDSRSLIDSAAHLTVQIVALENS